MYKNLLQQTNRVMTLSKAVDCLADPIALLREFSCRPGLKHGADSSSNLNKNINNQVLLESCEIDSKQKLKSILMSRAALRIECRQQKVSINSLSSNGDNALNYLAKCLLRPIETNENGEKQVLLTYQAPSNQLNIDEESRLKQTTPIDCLRKINLAFNSQNDHPFGLFLCGLFAFDFIASFEDLPPVPQGDNDCPDYVFYLAEEIILFDHPTNQTTIFSNVFSGENAEKNYFDQSRRIEEIYCLLLELSNKKYLNENLDAIKPAQSHMEKPRCDINDKNYQQIVNHLKTEITAGNIFQVVPSRTFTMPCSNPLQSYQQLKESNPSPYMFYMQDQNFVLFGASPESSLKYDHASNKVEVYPIAGTRARGKNSSGDIDHDLDKRLEAELKLDHKEIAEHMMLVDLARNDIARISKGSSLKIPRLLEVDRYSQVMHLVSCVQGELKNDLDCFHAYQACMNMGTLTGAPKIKASELIRQIEKKRRGSYGGAVGYINTQGDMDTCIVIRSAFVKKNIAYIQAGAGVVFDSDPHLESEETKNKAEAVIAAIQQSNNILPAASALKDQALTEQVLADQPKTSINNQTDEV